MFQYDDVTELFRNFRSPQPNHAAQIQYWHSRHSAGSLHVLAFPMLIKILRYFLNKIYGSNFIKQHSERYYGLKLPKC